MKNKKLTYILVPLVLIVWGLIIYRIFNTIHNTDDSPLLNTPIATINGEKNTLLDTFSLQLNYRDPFLGNLHRKISNENATKVVKRAPTPLHRATRS